MARNARGDKAEKAGKGKSRLFDDLSIAQVAAGALAAVTSMLLASQIGIYGSVIGVGVGSVVSAVASQLYKKFLQGLGRENSGAETGQRPVIWEDRVQGGSVTGGTAKSASDEDGKSAADNGSTSSAKEGTVRIQPLVDAEIRSR